MKHHVLTRFYSPVLILAATCPLQAQNSLNLPAQLGPTMTAPPFSVREKFDHRVLETFGLRGVVGSSMGAAIGQARDAPHEWGQGTEGFAKRFASGFGGQLSRQTMAFGLEGALHEDPRYFPSTEKGFRARSKNVLLQTVTTRTDSGGQRFAYARLASAFGAGELVNAWQPRSTRGAGTGLERGAITLGTDVVYNFLQEFFPFVRPRSLRH
jgi:hypothetical protein